MATVMAQISPPFRIDCGVIVCRRWMQAVRETGRTRMRHLSRERAGCPVGTAPRSHLCRTDPVPRHRAVSPLLDADHGAEAGLGSLLDERDAVLVARAPHAQALP